MGSSYYSRLNRVARLRHPPYSTEGGELVILLTSNYAHSLLGVAHMGVRNQVDYALGLLPT